MREINHDVEVPGQTRTMRVEGKTMEVGKSGNQSHDDVFSGKTNIMSSPPGELM